MTTFTNETLLSNVAYGIPSGNYDGASLDWASDGKIAASYYGIGRSNQTIVVNIANFVGIIVIEATLEPTWQEAVWAEQYRVGDTTVPTTNILTNNIQGNFTWLRARVLDFTAGNINSVSAAF